MSWKRFLSTVIAEFVGLQQKVSKPLSGFRILLYHAVGTPLSKASYGISIDPVRFEQHMAILARSEGVRIVSFCQNHATPSGLRVAVSFDDGFKDNLHCAAPILQKYHIPFTVFVTSSFLRGSSSEYLNASELRELAALPGVTIGSHGATHIPLADCDDRTLWRELHMSRSDLEHMIGRPVETISYPHGSVNLRVVRMAKKAGYTLGACSRFDINEEQRDPLLFCRTEVLAEDSERVFQQKLQGAWDWLRWRNRDPARHEPSGFTKDPCEQC